MFFKEENCVKLNAKPYSYFFICYVKTEKRNFSDGNVFNPHVGNLKDDQDIFNLMVPTKNATLVDGTYRISMHHVESFLRLNKMLSLYKVEPR